MTVVVAMTALMLLAADATPPLAPPTPAPERPLLAPVAVSPAPLPPLNRFRLSLTYTRLLYEDGTLGDDHLTTQALALHWTFASSTYVRNHFELGEQWEHAAGYSARGLRVDLISFGYPVRLVDGEMQFALEPIVTPLRGEILFPTGAGNFARLEGGLGLELLLTSHLWYAGIDPVHVDFRYWVYSSAQSRTGFTQLWPLRVSLGREF